MKNGHKHLLHPKHPELAPIFQQVDAVMNSFGVRYISNEYLQVQLPIAGGNGGSPNTFYGEPGIFPYTLSTLLFGD